MVVSIVIGGLISTSTALRAQNVTPAEARAITKDAYIYGFPMVDNYRIQYGYFVDSKGAEFKAPWNTISNTAQVFTPADTAIQTPNSDTPYSFLGLDLRADPIVLTLPPIEKNRYYSIQFVDQYTFNFDYAGSRTTGNEGGIFLVAGPHWAGTVPKGVTKVIRSETEFVLALYRTQLFDPADIDNVKKIQAGYKVQTLSEFLGKSTSPSVAPVDFVKPLTRDEETKSLRFFSVLNFILKFCPTDPSETELMKRFNKIGIGAGKTFDPDKLSSAMKDDLTKGMADAWADFEKLKKQEIDTGKVTSGDLFGTRAYLKNNYLYRMAGAAMGIYGNSKKEAMYPVYTVDAGGQPLNGANRYTVRFAPGQLPPVNAFWSLTMYKLPQSLLVANPINRYLINSPMLPHLVKDVDGGVTLYIQNKSPGKEKEPNWLPAPKEPFMAVMRLYWPKQAALDGTWKQPPMIKSR